MCWTTVTETAAKSAFVHYALPHQWNSRTFPERLHDASRAWNLHDWAEVYFEAVGWVPADQSFGIPAFARNADEEYFFLGGIDSWRMIVNTEYGMPLQPEKQYPRSETVDFQRGEVEWEGGNLYFPQWDYHMDIDYLNY